MRKLSLGVLLLATSFSVMACGGKKEAEETTPAAEETVVADEATDETTEETVEETTEEETQDIKIKIDKETKPAETSNFTPVDSKEGRWQKTGDGYRFILNSTNQIAKNTAIDIDGTIYYFDENGDMANEGWAVDSHGVHRYVKNGKFYTGWIDKTYYVDDNGMKTGVTEIDGVKYLFDEDGKAVNDWYQGKDGWYHAVDGKVDIGIKKIEDKTYGFDENGLMQTSETEIDGKKYIFNEDGSAKNGIVDASYGKVYCDDGEVQTGKVEVDGTVFAFDESGAMLTKQFVNGVYINEDGTPDKVKRITNVGAFADKDKLDDYLNALPDKFVEAVFITNGWKVMYDPAAKGSLEEIESTGSISGTNKFIKFHNIDALSHRFGHFVDFTYGKGTGVTALRTEESSKLGWDEYFQNSDTEYFSEAVGKFIESNLDKSKAPKTYDYVLKIMNENFGFEK